MYDLILRILMEHSSYHLYNPGERETLARALHKALQCAIPESTDVLRLAAQLAVETWKGSRTSDSSDFYRMKSAVQDLEAALADDKWDTKEGQEDGVEGKYRSLLTELWDGVRAHGLTAPKQGSDNVRLIHAYCGGIAELRNKLENAEASMSKLWACIGKMTPPIFFKGGITLQGFVEAVERRDLKIVYEALGAEVK